MRSVIIPSAGPTQYETLEETGMSRLERKHYGEEVEAQVEENKEVKEVQQKEEIPKTTLPEKEETSLKDGGDVDNKTSDGTKKAKFRRTLRPNSEMLKTLNLKPGANVLTYTVQSSIQGEQVLSANIYLWPANSKIVISGIDGTITK